MCLSCHHLAASPPLESHRHREGWMEGVGGQRKEDVTGTHVRGREEMTATGSLHSSFPLFSIHTSRLWQLTWRHESDDDILWPLPCLTHYSDTFCLDGMSALLTNLESSLLFSLLPGAKSLFKLFGQERRRRKGFSHIWLTDWKDESPRGSAVWMTPNNIICWFGLYVIHICFCVWVACSI